MAEKGKLPEMLEFLNRGVWRVRTEDLKGFRKTWVRSLRIMLIAQKEFIKDECSSKASALTFYSLLSIVPILALGFAIAKGFGFQKNLESFIFEQFSGHEDVIMQAVTFSRNLLERTSSGVIAGIGAVFLIWSVFKILNNIEQAFNSIWEVPEPRSWGRKLSDYLSIMLISPVLLIMSSSATILLSAQIRQLQETFFFLGMLSPLLGMILKVLPYLLIWLLLTFLYVFLPNVKVSMISGLLGGIVAGTVFVAVQWAYIRFQVGVASYNAIYGSFAALPLFLIWMNLSWHIVLAGFELTYAHQNDDVYEYDPDVDEASPSFRMLMTLHVAHHLVKNFGRAGKPLGAVWISEDLGIPRRMVREILEALAAAGLIIPVSGSTRYRKIYHPARDTDDITISFIMNTLADNGINNIPVPRTESLKEISTSLDVFRMIIENSEANVRLKDI